MSELTNMLFVPAGDDRKLAKLPTLDADAVILDLEDAVAVARKAQARAAAAAAVAGGSIGIPAYVRVNGVDSGLLLEDLEAVVVEGLHGIVLPKAESAAQLEMLDWLLSAFERRRGLAPGGVKVLPIVETPTGVLHVAEIARVGKRVERLCFGAGDFSMHVGVKWPPSGEQSATLVAAKAALVTASSAYGLAPPHDSVYPDFRDLQRLEHEAEEAMALGFGGKHAIHPAQVEVIRRVFRPSDSEVAWAQKVVAAFEEQESAGVANVSLDGQLVDYPVYERARRILERVGGAEGRGGHGA